MLKRLRIKFVCFCMLIVVIMLGVIFGLLYYSTGRSLEQESMQMMERIAMDPMQINRPNSPRGDVQLPYFCVLVNRVGDAVEVGGGFFDLSDKAVLDSMLQMTNEAKTKSGVLNSYGLRFSRFDTPMGECIVYADMTSEQSTLHNLVLTFVMVGSAAFLLLLGISILLAHWAVKPVEQAWKQQKQFVADASHELKTPLTVIMTNAELLTSPGCAPEDRQQFSGSILTMSEQMRGLVESLLDLARIDTAGKKKTLTPCSFSTAVTDAVLHFEPVFFEKEMPFHYEIDPEVRVKGTEGQLRQLAEILLDNASKYASPGGETVLWLKQLPKKRCLLEVSNRGEPIADEDLKNLFKRFYRADKARAMDHSYGLGLSIAQNICEVHHGKITAHSENGWNSFTVLMPSCSQGAVRVQPKK